MSASINIFNSQERISHILMLNSFFIPDIGLYQGQMGMAKYSKPPLSYDFIKPRERIRVAVDLQAKIKINFSLAYIKI